MTGIVFATSYLYALPVGNRAFYRPYVVSRLRPTQVANPMDLRFSMNTQIVLTVYGDVQFPKVDLFANDDPVLLPDTPLAFGFGTKTAPATPALAGVQVC
jgi:hypothetical protein